MIQRLIALTILLASTATAWGEEAVPADGANDKGLRILFVGQDPAEPKPPFAHLTKPRTLALFRERTAAFEALLRYHFTDVRVIHGADYKAAMSDDADVTVFDTRPTPLTKAERGKDPKTGEPTYRPPTYLPETFDRPALMISHNSAQIGESLRLKLDWM